MITERVLSERVVSVSLSNRGLSQDVASEKDMASSNHCFKDFDAKTRSEKREQKNPQSCLTAPNYTDNSLFYQ